MKETISTLAVRARLGDLLNRVDLRHDEFIIERKGKPLAALVPVEKLERLQALARRLGRELLARQEGSKLGQAKADRLAADAVRWARSRARKARRRK